MAKPVVIVVGADKGGVGKTTVSRTLLDYFSANNVPTRAFDTESPRGTLMRFHPDITEIVDMTTTSDQMKIFDTLSAGPSVSVIDVRAGLLSRSLASLRWAGSAIDVPPGRNGWCRTTLGTPEAIGRLSGTNDEPQPDRARSARQGQGG
jgi:hypothetical protein